MAGVMKTALLVLFLAGLAYFIIGLFTQKKFDKASLAGKKVLLTGASSGIGEEMAYMYAEFGANVFITARRENRLKEVVSRCESLGSGTAKFGYISADMSLEADREKMVQAALEFLGDVDQLILNHAVLPAFDGVWNGDRQQMKFLQQTMTVNFLSYVHLTALTLPSLRWTNGAIGVVNSAAGRFPMPFTLEYTASKFALDGFFSGLRSELVGLKRNVSITLMFLGLTDTQAARDGDNRMNPHITPNSPLNNFENMVQPVKDIALGMISATTRRVPDVYLPWFHRFLGIARNIMPWLVDYIDFGIVDKEII